MSAPAVAVAPSVAPAAKAGALSSPLGSAAPFGMGAASARGPALAPARSSPRPQPVSPVADAVQAVSDRVVDKMAQLAAQSPEHAALVRLSREVIEQIAWEVVPELAETIIRAELERFMQDQEKKS
jgi:hypothetical protein